MALLRVKLPVPFSLSRRPDFQPFLKGPLAHYCASKGDALLGGHQSLWFPMVLTRMEVASAGAQPWEVLESSRPRVCPLPWFLLTQAPLLIFGARPDGFTWSSTLFPRLNSTCSLSMESRMLTLIPVLWSGMKRSLRLSSPKRPH